MPVGGAGGAGSSNGASRSSNANSASKSTQQKSTQQKTTQQKTQKGFDVKDRFSNGLPECKVDPVKGGGTKSGTGVDNDVCTFHERDTWSA